jgi:uncharacterized protein YxeA
MIFKKIYYIGVRVLVVIIYIALIIKVFKVFQTDNSLVKPSDNSAKFAPSKRVYEKEQYQLDLKNKNPFKASKVEIPRKTNQSISRVIGVKLNDKIVKSWPALVYYGFVKADYSKNRKVVLKIDKRLYRKQELEEVDGVKILKAFHDSLQVQMGSHKKTIFRKKI